jgi:Na+-translocating ferredoxin:NAD+ oxidoreductase RNF subunit RnfB
MGRGFGRGMGMDQGPDQMGGIHPDVPSSPGTASSQEIARLEELAREMERQRDEVEQQVREVESGKKAGPVRLKAVVEEARCTGCGLCLDACPVEAIVLLNDVATIGDDCTACGACVAECPNEALAMGPA